jgi:6,7-dimethyl-8-ribityllumazine synthase
VIKSITILRKAKSAAEYKSLSALLESLGFERGREWKNAPGAGGKVTRGNAFHAPMGAIEILERMPSDGDAGDIWVEASDVEAVHRQAKRAAGGKVSEIAATNWKSRYFVLQAARLKVTFWQSDEPEKFPAQTIEGELNASGGRFGVVVSRFNSFITERLLQGALDALHRTGAKDKDIEIMRVPGAFEIPIGARKLAQSKKVDAVICLGILLRGETSNYEHISAEVARGIGQAAQDTGIPCAYGVLTCDTLEQAIDRAGLKMGNKGFEAAISAVEMVALGEKLKARRGKKVRAQRA